MTHQDLPITPAVYHILLALADEDRHGYGIMQEVAERTGGEVRLGPGTLYRSVKRLRRDGLITAVPDTESEADERRRYYRITGTGRGALRSEADRLARLVSQARAKRVISPAS